MNKPESYYRDIFTQKGGEMRVGGVGLDHI
jgi:hypothetical protein